MRRLISRLREEQGASAVMVGILLIPLIGCLAISLDVGALYVERAQLQNGADAAALAIAQECAEDGVCNSPGALANTFSDSNANDGLANNLAPSFPNSHTVVVSTSTQVAGGGNAIEHPFARLIGVDSTTVHATATAEWGSPAASSVVLPIAMSYCDFRPALDGTLQLIRYDENKTCNNAAGEPIPGGFGWLKRSSNGTCDAFVDLDTSSAGSEAGNSYPGACDSVMSDLEGRTVLVPIFDRALTTTGTAKSYHIYGFAAFTVTGWKFSGGNSMPQVNLDPAAPKCTGNCRGIQGFFSHWVSLDAAGSELSPTAPNLGASIVRLSN
ncbi:pilus assembly protein TadG-related protein [Naasia sp. SYSU D00948]|uniref:pilus assembly protein TadG-related protein n=1 Tax=Naasia sp. SYSU D00948 TaxID=2817379 RepID=UPI001B306F52|nr:pilus assembly protein TadG-related protein [Naasia sp. SYSU D00948]